MSIDIKALIAERESERYELHADHLNEQMVHVLKTIGFDKRYQRGVGQYLYDERGERYLDLLSGWGVFAVGRNHFEIEIIHQRWNRQWRARHIGINERDSQRQCSI